MHINDIDMRTVIEHIRTEHVKPSQYRLRLGDDGRLVLQGYYEWYSDDSNGAEWRDIETVRTNEVKSYD